MPRNKYWKVHIDRDRVAKTSHAALGRKDVFSIHLWTTLGAEDENNNAGKS